MNMKKTLAFALSVSMLSAVFTACGSKAADSTPDAAPADTAAAAETEAAAPAEHVVPTSGLPVADNAVDFAKSLKLGWNLGNTLDATGSKDLSSETSWSQPTTTKEIIDGIKDAGFTSIRIPVSWGNHTDADYNIDPAWMSRVTEVVDYAVEDGLYVIINSHHDCEYYYPSEEKLETSEKYLKTVWTQICENFKDYDESVIFESMNEPRLMNTSKEWWFRDNDEEGIASIKCIVKLNQDFVDVVRSSGGNNGTRYLMVPSNAAAPQNATNSAFEMPVDPANKLMVSIHAYTPYDFAGNENGYSTWDGSKNGEFNFMDQLDSKFTKNGYGVVIGEFGATNKDNLEDRVAWAKAYTEKAAALGIPCFLWDNGGTKVGSENFGMINRLTHEVYYPEILSAMLESYK